MKQKNRKGYLAGLLSLLCPGLGHVYAGNIKKGSLLYLVEPVTLLLFGLFGFVSTFIGFALLYCFAVVFRIYAIVSSIRLCKKNNPYALKKYNRWYWYASFFIVMGVINFTFDQYRTSLVGAETYFLTSDSMSPTLKAGDAFISDRRYESLKIGDVVSFRGPMIPSKLLAKRVAALSGDTISIESGDVIVNGEIRNELKVAESARRKDFSQSMKKVTIPEGEVFLLGDLRDNSADSRHWGTIKQSAVVAKVTYVYFSINIDRIGLKVK